MKIRKGFVSNSSSSSFTLFGWAKEGDVKDIVNLQSLINNKAFENFISRYSTKYTISTEEELNKYLEDDGYYELGEFLGNELNLLITKPTYFESTYFGIDANLTNGNTVEEKADNLANRIKNIKQLLLDSPYINQETKDYISKNELSTHQEVEVEG